MNLDLVITQIKALVPLLEGRVAGAADFQAGLEGVVNMPLPAAFVMPLADEAGDNSSENGLMQEITERFAVAVEFPNLLDRRGQAAVNFVEPMKYAMHRALLNWRIDPTRNRRAIYYTGGQLLMFDRARMFWQFDYAMDALITDADGYQQPSDPFVEIQATIEIAGQLTPTGFDVELPQ